MISHREEKAECDGAVAKAIEVAPMIARELIKARDVRRTLSERRESLRLAILYSRALADDLELRQLRLGWRDDKEAAA